ncbi:hypothetical protein ACEPAI_1430 [Sanghuangporus weigelae]
MKFSTAQFPALLAAACAEAQLLINTPTNAVQCQPLSITWSGGVGKKVDFVVVPGDQPSAPALVDLGQQAGTSLIWVVNVSAGTSIALEVTDSTGTIVQTAPFTVQNSSDSSCLR